LGRLPHLNISPDLQGFADLGVLGLLAGFAGLLHPEQAVDLGADFGHRNSLGFHMTACGGDFQACPNSVDLVDSADFVDFAVSVDSADSADSVDSVDSVGLAEFAELHVVAARHGSVDGHNLAYFRNSFHLHNPFQPRRFFEPHGSAQPRNFGEPRNPVELDFSAVLGEFVVPVWSTARSHPKALEIEILEISVVQDNLIFSRDPVE
jgi:hypothetical protein